MTKVYPPLIKLSDLDTSHPKVAYSVEKAKEFIHYNRVGVPTSIILSGPPGTGKTSIASALLWAGGAYIPPKLIDGVKQWDGQEEEELDYDNAIPLARYFEANDLINRYLDTNNEDGIFRGQPKIDVYLKGSPFVIIDDVGTEKNIPFVSKDRQSSELASRYYSVINYCYVNGIGLVITTNLSVSNIDSNPLKQLLGTRNWDRILEMCRKGFIISLYDVSSRRRELGGYPNVYKPNR